MGNSHSIQNRHKAGRMDQILCAGWDFVCTMLREHVGKVGEMKKPDHGGRRRPGQEA